MNESNRISKDTIYRQDAIDTTWKAPSYTDPLNVLTEVRDRIAALPSAQPEQQWIPCSERLPELHTDVIVTDVYGNVEIASLVDSLDDDGEKLVWWLDEFGEIEILAWMPLPEPWEGDEK